VAERRDYYGSRDGMRCQSERHGQIARGRVDVRSLDMPNDSQHMWTNGASPTSLVVNGTRNALGVGERDVG